MLEGVLRLSSPTISRQFYGETEIRVNVIDSIKILINISFITEESPCVINEAEIMCWSSVTSVEKKIFCATDIKCQRDTVTRD